MKQPQTPWLSVIGIGEDGLDGLGDLAWSLIAQAKVIYGGARHLAMLPDVMICDAEKRGWPQPFSHVFDELDALRGTSVVVLASGDPMYFGIGGTLARHFPTDEMRILSYPGSFSLAASRLGWPLDKVAKLTIHGRSIETLLPHYLPGARLLVLSRDGKSPREVADQLLGRGIEEAELTILEHLGGMAERIVTMSAKALAKSGETQSFADLNVLAIALPETLSFWLPLQPGLPDEAFEHDGKMTKRDIRASALAKLMPHPGALLWDVGTGCGSVAIEWLRSHPSCRAIGIEPQEKRRILARHNADCLGVPSLQLIADTAPDGLKGKDAPDAVFIGGGLSREVVDFCLDALKPGGRLVAHAVTLRSEHLLLELFEEYGGDLTRLAISRATPVGPYFGWKPSMPVTQWAFTKVLKEQDEKQDQ
ncbi:precorrin-6y C5,15-methyltransferase (decarboxylating) subunit CbiE [uncultured Cohaesibacter sp.]|uniref:precorrin-6y C5,15-methyltransferase (decarboxylating) subunit CbiE n=1 Tax=uncultured Cohaesibacter sp. TaxID=1002546 RepID=UPI0029C87503|nr:precorrin-6y C5,15-methyltransferase (decarboxylating) subunit CbiE [uncultured Cohaesibacter sp.]